MSLLKLCLSHTAWEEAKASGLSTADLPNKELQSLFSVLDNWHNTHDGDITVADLANLTFASVSKDHTYYQDVFLNLEKLDVSDDTSKVLLESIVRKRKLKELSLAAYEAGEGNMTMDKFNELVTSFKDAPEASQDDIEFISDDIEFIVQETFKTPGLRWRLKTLNKMMGSLRFGDFGFIFARPETGKTTLLASEVTFMAEQATKPVLWLANEEDGKKVMLRIYQATFGVDLPTLLSNLPKWRKLYQEKYDGRIKVVSGMQWMTKNGVQRLCDRIDPSLLIVDQLSKITGFDADRKDLELGAACEWGRNLAKTYCPVIAVHQADGTAEGVQWLNMGHVSNAKTAMQADADWIMGVGKKNQDGYESLRYLALSKNKLLGDEDTDPALRHGKMEVLIEPVIGRYKDLF